METTRSTFQQLGLALLEGVWLRRLIGTPSGVVRRRAVERRAVNRRWDLEKVAKVRRCNHQAAQRSQSSARHLTERWVDSVHDVGETRTRCTTRGYEQQLKGSEDSSQRYQR